MKVQLILLFDDFALDEVALTEDGDAWQGDLHHGAQGHEHARNELIAFQHEGDIEHVHTHQLKTEIGEFLHDGADDRTQQDLDLSRTVEQHVVVFP
mgnify:CR=1 FL=1